MTDQTALPLYLQGRFAPVPEEYTAAGLTVRGSLPPDLDGRYLRNGPNPLPGEDRGTGSPAPACCTASGCAAAAPSGTATGGSRHGSWRVTPSSARTSASTSPRRPPTPM
jgi:hypothetical protein